MSFAPLLLMARTKQPAFNWERRQRELEAARAEAARTGALDFRFNHSVLCRIRQPLQARLRALFAVGKAVNAKAAEQVSAGWYTTDALLRADSLAIRQLDL